MDLTIAATGGDTPAFSMTVPAPGYIDVSAPAGDEYLTVATDTDMQVSWTGGQGADASVLVLFWDGPPRGSFFNASLTCTFPVEAQHGSVPSAMLSKVPKGSSGEVYIMSENRSELVLDGWDFWMDAWSFGSLANSGHDSAWHVQFE